MNLFEVHNFKRDASNEIKQVRRTWTLTAQDEGNCSISAKQVNYCRKGEELIVINKTDLKKYRRYSKFYLKNNPNFFVGYERDGTWVDEGVTHFNIHDLKSEEELCYGVKLTTVKG